MICCDVAAGVVGPGTSSIGDEGERQLVVGEEYVGTREAHKNIRN